MAGAGSGRVGRILAAQFRRWLAGIRGGVWVMALAAMRRHSVAGCRGVWRGALGWHFIERKAGTLSEGRGGRRACNRSGAGGRQIGTAWAPSDSERTQKGGRPCGRETTDGAAARVTVFCS
ncbi:hypothetical protein E2562_035900 [Oryza meyeriana var. granulata]|uniref:Uncharacterized protein n=1 Tax=Oryza meyeriana var. granulata TaxID=110450 RepID=A0A6G1E9J3_9ORYZ|nr:hypothetical protein E2562_035900 [Oryza meyeriana var. granulata]